MQRSLLALSGALIALLATQTPVFASFGVPSPGTPYATAFLSDSGRQVTMTGGMDCSPQAGTPWRVSVHLTQGGVAADGAIQGTCGSDGTTWSVELTPAGGTSFRSGSASYVAVYSAGNPQTNIENMNGTVTLFEIGASSSLTEVDTHISTWVLVLGILGGLVVATVVGWTIKRRRAA